MHNKQGGFIVKTFLLSRRFDGPWQSSPPNKRKAVAKTDFGYTRMVAGSVAGDEGGFFIPG
jgi:hypothetical protein